ncbi:MAG TPA: urease accessory protein UreD [Ruminiclostridium sp.]
MTDNNFGRLSRLLLSSKIKNGQTILADEYFTAPFKIMKPFAKENGDISVMLLTASAGLMQGDRQKITLNIGQNTALYLTSQAFEKIHKMTNGYAERATDIIMEDNSFLNYSPLPVIPFAQSDYRAITNISLTKSSKLIISEVLSCGRYCCDERFLYKNYSSLIQTRREERLVYRDNTIYRPSQRDMENAGFYEGHTHLLSLTAFGFKPSEEIKRLLDGLIDVLSLDGGTSITFDDDFVFRVLGNSGDELYKISEQATGIIEKFK